jgi:hypothetical protein
MRVRPEPHSGLPSWCEAGKVQQWNDKFYAGLRQNTESLHPVLRDQVLGRIRRLDCNNPDPTLASCDPSMPQPVEATPWRKALKAERVDDLSYAQALAEELKRVLCSYDATLFTLHGLLNNGRIDAAGSEAPRLLDFVMSKDCPISASLTDADKAILRQIKQDANNAGG